MVRGARITGGAERLDWTRLVVLSGVVVCLVLFGMALVPGDATATHANESDNRIQVVDAYPTDSGDIAVAVQAQTSQEIDSIQLWYDNGTHSEGPIGFNDPAYNGSAYDNQTAYLGEGFSNESGANGIVWFYLDHPYESGEIELNATAYGTDYSAADPVNRSVMTANAYQVTLQDASGTQLTDRVPMVLSNSSSAAVHGIVFPVGSQSFHCGGVVESGTCVRPDDVGSAHAYVSKWSFTNHPISAPVPSSLSVSVFNVATGNGSIGTTVSPSANTIKLDEPTAPVNVQTFGISANSVPVETLRVVNRTSGETVYDRGPEVDQFAPPFLSPKTPYELVFENQSTFGTERRYVTVPTRGLTQQQFLLPDGTGPPTSPVTGQVVNESGDPVADVVVSAEDPFSSQPRQFGSAVTDENGTFSLTLPESEAVNERYGFRLVSNRTSDGTLQYFPTKRNGDGNGFVVYESKTVLPALVIEEGGEVGVNVTNASGGEIPSVEAVTSLSQTTNRTGVVTRSALSESFTLLAFDPQNKPNSTDLRLASPSTGAKSNVAYNVWTPEQSGIGYVCAEQVSVAQGSVTESECELEETGTLVVELDRYNSILDQGTASAQTVGTDGFFFRNVLVLRNATTGNVTTYFGPGGVQPFLLNNPTDTQLALPVPAGNYTLEIRPAEQFQDRTTVRNTTTVEVAGGGTSTVQLKSGADFDVEPVPGRFPPGLSRTAANDIAVNVTDPATGAPLADSDADVSLKFHYQNKSLVDGSEVDLSYNNSGVFETKQLTPSDLGMDSGIYIAALTVSHENGTSTYNTTIRAPVEVSDFTVDIRANSRTVGPGSTFAGGFRAYNLTTDPPTGINASAGNITIQLADENGNVVTETTPDEGIDTGRGSFAITAPTDTGNYRVSAFVESDQGRQGIGDTWIRVSGIDVEVSLDQSVYAPDETVTAEVTVQDSRTGDTVGATVDVTVNGQTTTSATGTDGAHTFVLEPANFSDGSTWSGSTFVQVVANAERSDGVSRARTGAPLRVRQFEARASPSRSQFGPADDVTIDVFFPPSVTVDAVAATGFDGEGIEVPGSQVEPGYWQVSLGDQPGPGTHFVEISARNQAGDVVTDTVRINVVSFGIGVSTEHFEHAPGENVNVTADLRYPNGSAVSGESITVRLDEVGNQRRQVNQTTATTGSDGRATAEVSSGVTGPHEVVVSAGGQQARVPVLVTDVDATLTDASENPVESYTFEPGTTANVYVEAENATGDVPNGTQVAALGVLGDEVILLDTGETSSGSATLSFDVPASVNTGTYGLEVRVRTPSGGLDRATAAMKIAGGNAVSLDVGTASPVYTAGDTARFTATATQAGSPVTGQTVEFALVGPSTDRTLGTTTTGDGGNAVFEGTVPSDLPEGPYTVRARLPSSGIEDTTGVLISGIEVRVESDAPAYTPGENVSLTVTAMDSNGDHVTADEAAVRVRLPDGGEIIEPFSRAGPSPYSVNVTLPDDPGIAGTRTVEAGVKNGSSVNFDATLVDVRNASENSSLTVPTGLTAGESFDVDANATVDTTATLRVFSPGSSSVAVERSVDITAGVANTTSVTLDSPGTYVFELDVPGIGTETVVRPVEGTAGDPTVSVGPDLSTNETTFSTTEDVYVRTGASNMTATVIGPEETYTISLNRQQGGVHYGVLDVDRPAGTYLVRLDGPDATDIDSQVIEVSDGA